MNKIKVKGAREHNLKNISLEIPKNKLVVITGVSGSGKSSLAFDTLYAEGQRRYVESLSSYARQFLGIMDKPDVDFIEGLSPAISIEQKSTSKNPRSTVGTTTEIYDYLRLLFARVGKPHCPKCGDPVSPHTKDMITESVMQLKGQEVDILSPVARKQKGTHQKLFEKLNKDGYSLVIVDGHEHFTDDKITLSKTIKHDISVLVDRFIVDDKNHVADSIETALNLSGGYVVVRYSKKSKKLQKLYTSHSSCPKCEIFLDSFEPRHFSFNSPFGACRECSGLGVNYSFDIDLVIPDKSIAIGDGAIKAFRSYDGYRVQNIASACKVLGLSIFDSFQSYPSRYQDAILYGLNANLRHELSGMGAKGKKILKHLEDYEAVIPLLERLYEQTESEYVRKDLERFMRSSACGKCRGQRLKKEILSVFINNKNIIEITEFNISRAVEFFKELKLDKTDTIIASQILKEIGSRLGFLDSVGLGYLSLSRSMETLSGGEAQRIRLATQIGSNLTGVMYVLDEPSIGLHQRDNNKLIDTLKRLRDIGNTVIVVEHDEDTMLEADHIIDIGPSAGVHGGKIIAEGNAAQICANKESLTGRYLSQDLTIYHARERRKSTRVMVVSGARENNLKNIEVTIPSGIIACVTGVSGSGKSTLVNEIIAKALSVQLNRSKEIPGKHDSIRHNFRSVVNIDQDPIGRTPRSNPATYTKVFDHIRKIFASTKEAKARGYKEGRFSFNVKGGRCERCSGDGTIKMEMHFLPDVYVKCDACNGKRYNSNTLEILYKGKNIHQVLSMTVEEALEFFKHIPQVQKKLETLNDVGLGYIELGQNATTLSGGEAQRIKLSRELSKASAKDTLYILDEPTTGLHFADVDKLLGVINRLVDKGGSCLIIEHNLDVIKSADYIIDMGPEGGEGGGMVIASGTPEEVSRNRESYTGRFLKKVLMQDRQRHESEEQDLEEEK